MSASRNPETSGGISPSDIYFVLFRHKWKIIVLTLLGLAGAGVYYFTQQPLYQSDAQVYIRYIADYRTQNPTDNNSRVTSMIDVGNILNSEMALMCSPDLAAQVATNLGPEKILAKSGGGNDAIRAAGVVLGGLRVQNKPASSIIDITFRNPDPDLVKPVLTELITDYEFAHEQLHKAINMSDESLSDEASKLNMDIRQIDDELRIAKTNAGIISLADADKSYQEKWSRISDDLWQARMELADHRARLAASDSMAKAATTSTNSATAAPADQQDNYKTICARLTYLTKCQSDYIQQGYTDENKLMKENAGLMKEATKTKTDLEKKYPALADLNLPATASSAAGDGVSLPNVASEKIQISALPLHIEALEAKLAEIQAQAAELGDAEMKIQDLERKKKIKEDYFQSFESRLEQAQIEEEVGPEHNGNMRVIVHPTWPYKDYSKFYKAVGLLSLSGLLLGLAWAILIEFYLDRSVKRPVDLHTRLRIPFFLSIPDLNHGPRNRLAGPERPQLAFNGNGHAGGNGEKKSAGSTALEIASPAINQALHSHYDALRDRLVNYFESINLTRKPKLVAITSTSKGAGVSTISAGLAASLSETGDGRVLLVDMNLENGAAQQFVRGQPGCQLDDALVSEKRDHALVQENLYVVSEGSNADKLPRILPKRFSSLVPKLRASDYDYIIFDMPPVTQTSVTTRLAGFMDTVMLIVESEKTDRDVVQQAHQLLQQSKANVTAVLNKTRKYIPARLQHDIHADM